MDAQVLDMGVNCGCEPLRLLSTRSRSEISLVMSSAIRDTPKYNAIMPLWMK
jgi:hypothetical protein